MRLIIVLILLIGFFTSAYSQTADFTISLLLRYSIDEKHNPDFSNYQQLAFLSDNKDFCIYRCNLNNVCSKADSIIMEVGLKRFGFYDLKNTLELRQYYTILDSAIQEYNEYFKCLLHEFETDNKFYKFKLIKIKDMDSTYFGTSKMWKENIITNKVEFRSLYIWSNLYLSLESDQNKFVILTRIN